MSCTTSGKATRMTINNNIEADTFHDISSCNGETNGEFSVIQPWLPVVASSYLRYKNKYFDNYYLIILNTIYIEVKLCRNKIAKSIDQ